MKLLFTVHSLDVFCAHSSIQYNELSAYIFLASDLKAFQSFFYSLSDNKSAISLFNEYLYRIEKAIKMSNFPEGLFTFV